MWEEERFLVFFSAVACVGGGEKFFQLWWFLGMAVEAQYYSESMALAMCGLPDWWVNPVSSSGFDVGASSNFSLQQLPPSEGYLLYNQQGIQDFSVHDHTCPNPIFSCSSTGDGLLPMAFSQSLSDQLETQRLEIDWLLHVQVRNRVQSVFLFLFVSSFRVSVYGGDLYFLALCSLKQLEKMRFALQEQRKQQVALLLNRLESKTMALMRQKEEDLERARKKLMELEDWLRNREMENQRWQRVATENEAMVQYLNKKLEQVRETHILLGNGAEDAESYGGGSGPIDRGEDEGGEEVREQRKRMACKRCNSRTSCFLLLPCRHLCSCKSCEPFLDSCPVCTIVKEGSMEVFLV